LARFKFLIYFIGIFFIAAVTLGFSNYNIKNREQQEQLRLSYAIDYSVNAAVDALLESSELGLDYEASGKILVDPSKALDAFVDTFLFNYSLSVSDANKTLIKAKYMPVFLVATYDGYYLASSGEMRSDTNVPENASTNSDIGMIWTPKMPYKYTNAGSSYALNFGAQNYLRISGGAITKGNGFPPGLADKTAVIAEINKVISTDIAYKIESLNAINANYSNSFFIPTALTAISGTNAIEGPSVIALVQNLDLTTIKPISSFSIGGGKIQQSRFVIGFTEAGVKYYAYADQVPLATITDELFPNIYEAAASGFFPHPVYFQN